jgi:DNA-binding transcriptional MerR regulator
MRSAEAGGKIQTLRYNERRGLLPLPERTPSEYRDYRPQTVRPVPHLSRRSRVHAASCSG